MRFWLRYLESECPAVYVDGKSRELPKYTQKRTVMTGHARTTGEHKTAVVVVSATVLQSLFA